MSERQRMLGAVLSLREEPDNDELALVVADWCEEKGFEEAMTLLRTPFKDRDGLAFARTTLGLVLLFEEPGFQVPGGQYSAMMGLPPTSIAPAARATICTHTQVPFYVQKVALQARIASSLNVLDVRIGNLSLLYNSEPVPGEMFHVQGPDLFDRRLEISQSFALVVENNYGASVWLTGCVVGESVAVRERRRGKKSRPETYEDG